MDTFWIFDMTKAPAGKRLLVAWRADDGTSGVCEAQTESAFGYGGDTAPTWHTMSGDADGLGDAAVPGTVCAWALMPAAPNPQP